MILPQVHLRNGGSPRFLEGPDYILDRRWTAHDHLVCERAP